MAIPMTRGLSTTALGSVTGLVAGLAIGIVTAIVTGLAGLATSAVAAEDYPVRPVRLIVGFGPGASGDVAARVIAQPLGRLLGQQFVVENRTGAGSNIATSFVARAAKDGYTLLGTVGNTINASYANLNFDFLTDLVPIVMLATQPNILVVHPATDVRISRSSSASPARGPTGFRSARRASQGGISPASCST